jgi:hypothetical protein
MKLLDGSMEISISSSLAMCLSEEMFFKSPRLPLFALRQDEIAANASFLFSEPFSQNTSICVFITKATKLDQTKADVVKMSKTIHIESTAQFTSLIASSKIVVADCMQTLVPH